MNKQTLFITSQSATGVYGYTLEREGVPIFVNSNAVLPDPQPVAYKNVQTGKVYSVYHIPSREHPTIVPGLKIKFRIYDEENESDSVLEAVYGASYQRKINAYVNDNLVFKYYPQTEDIFISPTNELIAFLEDDLTFKHDPCSMNDRRYILQINDEYMDILPLIFHAFISVKLRVL